MSINTKKDILNLFLRVKWNAWKLKRLLKFASCGIKKGGHLYGDVIQTTWSMNLEKRYLHYRCKRCNYYLIAQN